MLKKLTQIGSSWGLIIPKATLALLNINPVLDKVVITTTEDSIIIKNIKNNYHTYTQRNLFIIVI